MSLYHACTVKHDDVYNVLSKLVRVNCFWQNSSSAVCWKVSRTHHTAEQIFEYRLYELLYQRFSVLYEQCMRKSKSVDGLFDGRFYAAGGAFFSVFFWKKADSTRSSAEAAAAELR